MKNKIKNIILAEDNDIWSKISLLSGDNSCWTIAQIYEFFNREYSCEFLQVMLDVLYKWDCPLQIIEDKIIFKEKINVFSQELLQENFKFFKGDIIVFRCIDSTNNFLLNVYNKDVVGAPVACFADYQTSSRGRGAKSWYSPFACNIYMSYKIDLEIKNQMEGVSIVIAYYIVTFLQKYYKNKLFSIKWPNDILLDGKKIAGILIESEILHGKRRVVIGLGCNVNMQDETFHKSRCSFFQGESLSRYFGYYQDKNKLASLLLDAIDRAVSDFIIFGFSHYKVKINSLLEFSNEQICFYYKGAFLQGLCCGVDERGYLAVKKLSGEYIYLLSADVEKVRFKGLS